LLSFIYVNVDDFILQELSPLLMYLLH